jgi:uncharacterized protein (TIGR00290 family)
VIPVLLSWSGGKDSALALHRLQQSAEHRVVGLVTTVTQDGQRVSVHGVQVALLRQQAAAAELPLIEIPIPDNCPNSAYLAAWSTALDEVPAPLLGARTLAFGDIFLEDVRSFREDMAAGLGFGSLFPIWGEATAALAVEATGPEYDATLVCVDTHALPAAYAGRRYDRELLDDLPAGVDPCGERGEFHTFVSRAPCFRREVGVRPGAARTGGDRFAFRELEPA